MSPAVTVVTTAVLLVTAIGCQVMSASERRAEVARLPEPDVRLLRLVAAGLSSAAVAREASISERTLRRRLHAICGRLGVGTVIEAVVLAVRSGRV